MKQAQLYKQSVENRVNYLQNEERKYLFKIHKTRADVEKIEKFKTDKQIWMEEKMRQKALLEQEQ